MQKRRTAEQAALAVVHRHFRPEFLNRLDEVVVFDALTPLQLREIARLQVRRTLGAVYVLSTTVALDMLRLLHFPPHLWLVV